MSIQDEIHKALRDIQEKVRSNKKLSPEEMELLFLSSLIEEEGKNVSN